MNKVSHFTYEAFLLSRIVRGNDGRECRVIAKQAGFGDHYEQFSTTKFDGVRWKKDDVGYKKTLYRH